MWAFLVITPRIFPQTHQSIILLFMNHIHAVKTNDLTAEFFKKYFVVISKSELLIFPNAALGF